MEIAKVFLHIIEYVFFIYFAVAAVYVFVFSFAGIFSSSREIREPKIFRRFAVLIPGYKEDAVILEVAGEALKQDYPPELFDIIVIADSFSPATIQRLKKMPVKLVEVSFEKSTKSKALNKAMASIDEPYDVALVLDADNIMNQDFIRQINLAFDEGFRVVQGHRAAKNLNTPMAILDAISEEVNNHIFRKGHRNLGLSSALIGSGMAFEYSFFREIMAKVKAVGGFDKELELNLLRDRIKIEYLHHAIVLDEKVQKTEVFASQRKRWLSAQFIYFRRYFFSGLKHLLLKGNLDFFDKVYQMVSPPRVLLLGIVTILAFWYGIVSLIRPLDDIFTIGFQSWLLISFLVYLAFLFAIPLSFYTRNTLNAVGALPKAFLTMFISLFRLRGANKKFIHTTHGVKKEM